MRVDKGQDGVAEVVLVGPGKGNAMGPEFWRELPEVFTELDHDRSVRVVLLRGEGENFSYGLDVKAMMPELGPHFMGDNLAANRAVLLDIIGSMQRGCDLVAKCRKPVIAAVSGWCIGGGLDLVAACDIRYASREAKFSLREVKLAIVADVGSIQRLPAIIGQGRTREMAFTGGDFGAAWALRAGLVNEVCDSPEELLTMARARASEVARNAPLTVQGIKQVMEYCEDKSIADGLRYVAVWNSAFLQSKDLGEAITAFTERRPPKFDGE